MNVLQLHFIQSHCYIYKINYFIPTDISCLGGGVLEMKL